VPEFCTCGAQLPPDARFCHKCGKPQYDYVSPVVEEPAPVVPQVLTPQIDAVRPVSEIGFHNGLAVRIGLIAAMSAVLVLMIPLPFPFVRLFVAPIAAGFFAVFLYSRRTGQNLSVRSGRRMGWITGIFVFTFVGVLSTVAIIAISNQGELTKTLQSQFPANDPNSETIAQAFNDPTMVGVLVLLSLALLFVVLTALPMIGGALGAKVLDKQ
jgi:hypothetical protein